MYNDSGNVGDNEQRKYSKNALKMIMKSTIIEKSLKLMRNSA